jgi:UDP-N-acetylmuramate--alanine ligase
MFERYRVIHFIGIGGIGMSGIAEVLYNLGYEVTGSDARASAVTERLAGLGIRVHIGHRAEQVQGAHVVVTSSAVKEDNPEVRAARAAGIPVIPRAEMLAELARLKYSLLVAGSHGKTTTTSLLATIMAHAGFDPTVVIGGKLKAIGTNARLGRGEFLVAEADESDGSFLKLSPAVGVVTNIDREHMDHFKTMEALEDAFVTFMNKVPFYGTSVVCLDDPRVAGILPRVHRHVLTYGLHPDADLRAVEIVRGAMRVEFEAELRGQSLGRFTVPLPGVHTALNAMAALGVALELQIEPDRVREALAGFEGIQRRLEYKGSYGGARVYDDYGHHPTEVRATLKAARDGIGNGRLVVIFQPHRYTRTSNLMDEFATSFDEADHVLVMDIYAAGESPLEGVTAEALARRMTCANARYTGGADETLGAAALLARDGDLVLTLGAGDVWKVGERLVKEADRA